LRVVGGCGGEWIRGRGGYHAVHEAAETPEGVGVVLEDCVDYAEEVAHSLDIAYCQLHKEPETRTNKTTMETVAREKTRKTRFSASYQLSCYHTYYKSSTYPSTSPNAHSSPNTDSPDPDVANPPP